MRYEGCTSETEALVEEIIKDEFPNLDGANIMVVMDTKKKVSSGRYIIARIKKMNDELKFFTANDFGITYDYVMFIDKVIFEELDLIDQKRVIYHELCHCEVDPSKTNPYGIKDHEIQGFHDEITFNEDDPRWSERISLIAESIYDVE
jgi:predicted metallopeptidase